MGLPQRKDSILDGRLITERRIVKAEMRERLREREREREGSLGLKQGVLVVDDFFSACNISLALTYLRYLFAKVRNMDF